MRVIRLASLLVFLSCCSAQILFGQVNTAGLSGLVTNAAGSAIAGVKVKMSNTATGYVRAVITDRFGYYTLRNMPIGHYGIAAEEDGFSLVEESIGIFDSERFRG
ncbi:carboxypeptidase regulatory-like domain-containing protein [Granulicella sp. WH15]|uniref:carboxypeptidase-like regulatory domain-containing protein n=1 Tax=Granulicella sp. WH15 TaxID=2602070 RepID=UPI001366A780|nr:carboxypeptidase-like regulatory domain-containing protein [Granulicella sp. WH15]QHN05002.1 carboxypeptidase regulatory-like domain-containing protein [Granulicella sp. WH15]